MNITLNDVSCILHILIHGKLVNNFAKISQEQDDALISQLLGVEEDNVTTECDKIGFREKLV